MGSTTTNMPFSSQLILLFVFFLSTCLSPDFIHFHAEAADSISLGRSLSGNQTIVSKGGRFELGFFRPGNESLNFYVGIWYNASKQTVVWVANREAPISNPSSSELRISEDGNLVLLDESEIVVWSSSNSSIKNPNSSVATLRDDANLVLEGSSGVIWQSFDHPTNTWLPGAWLGRNKITGEVQKLTSWRSSDDPSPGLYSLSIDPNGTSEYFLKWNDTQIYWRSGDWSGRIFDQVPEMNLNMNLTFNVSFIDNEKWFSFSYNIYNTSSIVSHALLDSSGKERQMIWLDVWNSWREILSIPQTTIDRCDVNASCGAFGVCDDMATPRCQCPGGFEPISVGNSTVGCSRKSPLHCGRGPRANGSEDRPDMFMAMPNVLFPNASQTMNSRNREVDCQLACLNSCSCTAYAYDPSTARCSLWNGDLLGLRQLPDGKPSGGSLHIRVAATSESQRGGKGKRSVTKVTAAVVAAVVVAVAAVLGLLWECHYKHRWIGPVGLAEGSLVAFKYRFLQSATRNFSEKLGAGGFGEVFRGVLPDSTIIAVKALKVLQQGDKQFRAEVNTLGTIQHINLVRLRGFCSSGAHRLLVYDYMPNGSLNSHLFQDSSNSKVLDWGTRYNILLGVARGLTYLHEKCRECIVHCDIKPENILLDAEFCPKIADFGLAKLVGREFSRVLTSMRGTVGYLAPEWISGLPITSKADVYSYGMMVLEMLSGKRNSTVQSEEGSDTLFFPVWAASRINEGEMLQLVDQRLEGEVNVEELRRACRVAFWCIQGSEDDRPSMGSVVQILEGVVEVGVPPIPRFLQNLVGEEKPIIFYSVVSTADPEPKI